MTLILKSDVVAKNAISDKHGVISAKDWKLMLDFENQEYVERNGNALVGKSINDLVMTSNINPIVYTKDDDYLILPDNSLRLSLNRNKSAFGLLEEATTINYYCPSDAPVSKTIDLLQGSNVGPWVLKMVGSGSVTISGASITNATSLVITEQTPCYFHTESPSSPAQIAIEVTGDVQYLGLFGSDFGTPLVLNNYTDNTLIKTQFSSWWFDQGITKLKPEKVSEYLLNKKNFSIVFQCIDNDYLNFNFTETVYKPLLELVNAGKHISIMKRKAGASAEELAIRLFNTSEVVVPLNGVQKTSTIAISSGDNGLYFSVNGIVSNPSQVMSDFTIADILIGSSSQWITAFNAKAQGIFTKFAIYDRQLSVEELGMVSKSFM